MYYPCVYFANSKMVKYITILENLCVPTSLALFVVLAMKVSVRAYYSRLGNWVKVAKTMMIYSFFLIYTQGFGVLGDGVSQTWRF
ncbi:MAG: hypothetical protein DRR19_29000 [Candidatus Parabeggiatoa sp. nov. 1]|nr:MAG: hypothetical protein DRR19_29000 [Gammaproteobacteria bacterium]